LFAFHMIKLNTQQFSSTTNPQPNQIVLLSVCARTSCDVDLRFAGQVEPDNLLDEHTVHAARQAAAADGGSR